MLYLIIIILSYLPYLVAQEPSPANASLAEIIIDRTDQIVQKIPLTFIACTVNTEKLAPIGKLMELFGHFQVTITTGTAPETTDAVRALFDQKKPMAIFFEQDSAGISWRLYDTYGAHMIKGKRYATQMPPAHTVAHDLWTALTTHESPFSGHIAYVKHCPTTRFAHQRGLATNLIDGSQETIVTKAAKGIVAPQWITHRNHQYLTYSQFTHQNVKIVGISETGNRWNIIDLPGTNAGIACRPDSTDILYCHSGTIRKLSYDPQTKLSAHSTLIRESEPVAQPIWCADGTILYASNGVIKRYDPTAGTRKVISSPGFCAGPAYHEPSKTLVYAKRIKGTMQLCAKSLDTGVEEQLTTGPEDKTDPALSPGGTYLVYCHEYANGTAQIKAISRLTREQISLTPRTATCRYPTWGP